LTEEQNKTMFANTTYINPAWLDGEYWHGSKTIKRQDPLQNKFNIFLIANAVIIVDNNY